MPQGPKAAFDSPCQPALLPTGGLELVDDGIGHSINKVPSAFAPDHAQFTLMLEETIALECVRFTHGLQRAISDRVRLLESRTEPNGSATPRTMQDGSLLIPSQREESQGKDPSSPRSESANTVQDSANPTWTSTMTPRQPTMTPTSAPASKRGHDFHLQMQHGGFLRQALYNRCSTWIEWWFTLEEPIRKGRFAYAASSKVFEAVCAVVIIVNGLFAVYTTNEEVKNPGQDPGPLTKLCEILFLLFYSWELGLKLVVHRLYFFTNEDMRWNIFDFVLVGFSAVDALSSAWNQEDNETMDITFMRSLRLMKLAKILRMVRVMRFFAELRVILNSLLGSLLSLFWACVMLGLIFYIFGLLFVQGCIPYLAKGTLTDAVEADVLLYYGSVEGTMMTLFKASTGGDDWAKFYEVIEHTGTVNCTLFVLFILFIEIALMNILTGIFVESAMKLAQPDRDALALDLRKLEREQEEELRDLCSQFDIDGSGHINKEQLSQSLAHGKMKANLAVLGLDIKDAELFFTMLTEASNGQEVNIEAFVSGCMRLKGGATSLDMQLLVFGNQMIYKATEELQKELDYLRENRLQLAHNALPAVPPNAVTGFADTARFERPRTAV